MKTKITYYAERLAKGQLSAYEASLHFQNFDQFKRALKIAKIIKDWKDECSYGLKSIEIDDAWAERAEDLYYDWGSIPTEEDYYYWQNPGEVTLEWDKAEFEAMGVPSDRQLWICRQARNAANTFPRGKWPWEVPHIPEEAWKKFFKTYRLSQSERDMFWMEYYLYAYDVFN